MWMYLERVPLVVYAPGRVAPADVHGPRDPRGYHADGRRVHRSRRLARDRAGRPLVEPAAGAKRPKVVVTFVIDGGGWNVLLQWPDRWPHLERLMGQGANHRNAIVGSFPAVTACAHATIGTGTYPSQHGITGHNIRDGNKVRKAYGEAGHADPGDILVPTLADLWSDATDNRAWVGEIGYQVWHLGMLGYGGRSRPSDACRSASTGTSRCTTRTASAAGRRTTPTSSGCRSARPGSTCTGRMRMRSTPRAGTPSTPRRAVSRLPPAHPSPCTKAT